MRKKFFFIAVSAIVAVSAGIFAYLNSESKSDDLFSANVEALADNEGSGTICYYTYVYSPGTMLISCYNCRYISNAKPGDYSATGHCL